MDKLKLSEDQIILLKDKLNYLMEKYEIYSPHFLDLIDDDVSEFEDYDFSKEKVDIWMNDEAETLEYSIDQMLRYLPNIENFEYDGDSAWCKNIKQIIINVNEWDAERINITNYSFKGEHFSIKFVRNPFYIGVAAIIQGITNDDYYITPCSRYVAAEFEYFNDDILSQEDECRILKQLLYTISVETVAPLKIGQFFVIDDIAYDFDDDDENEIRKQEVCYSPEDILSYTKAMDYFSKAIEIEDEEIKYLYFYKIIEYFSPVASKKGAYNLLNLRLDALKIKNRDQQYLESIFQLTRDYDMSLKDKELATTVLRECVDSLELFDALPLSIQMQIKKRVHVQKDMVITEVKAGDKENIETEIGQILYSTRNQIVHAKSNYNTTGYECKSEDLEQLNFFMKKLCQCLIIWNNRQPDEYRLN